MLGKGTVKGSAKAEPAANLAAAPASAEEKESEAPTQTPAGKLADPTNPKSHPAAAGEPAVTSDAKTSAQKQPATNEPLPAVDLSELKKAITVFDNESNDSISREIAELTAKKEKHTATLEKLNATDSAPKEHFGEQLTAKFVNDDAAVAIQGKQFQTMTEARHTEFEAMKAARASELTRQEEQHNAMNEARAAEYKAMTEARTSDLELRKNQFLADLVKREEEDAATNDRYLRTLIRIKKRRSRHNDLHANTKTVVGHVETALSDIVTNTDQQAQKVLNDANAHADQITAAATTRFEEQHQELDDKHTTLTDVVNSNKDETDAAITAAEEKATADIAEAKKELDIKLKTQTVEINDHLGAHDVNHKITKNHIIYVDRQQSAEKKDALAGNNEKINAHFLKRYEDTWRDTKPAASPVSGADQEKATEKATTDQEKATKSQSPTNSGEEKGRRRLASMSPSEQALERRRLANRPKSHIVVLEQLLEEINRLN